MRVLRTLPLLVAGVLLMGGTPAELAVPTAVSPGATRGADIAIADACPTFSWSASTGADSYELTVYRVGDDGRDVRPVLIERFLSPALSWTPSLDRCLAAGARYAWSVRAGHGGVFSDWSESSLFRVVAATGVEGSTEWLSRGIPRVSEDNGAEGAEDDESADAESATDSAQDRALRLPTADTLLSVDGNVAAVSFSGSGSALTSVDAQELDGIDSSDFLQKREIDRELELEALLGDVTNVLTDDETAATAAALRHDAVNCPAGEFAAGVSASGAAQGCAVPADAHASPTRNTRLGDLALSSNTTGEGNTATLMRFHPNVRV